MITEINGDFKNKKVLVMGLGLLGGGVATAKWFIKQGARVTVTDLKTKRELTPSIKKLGVDAKKIRLVLGRHRIQDFKANDIIVANPAVPRESKFLRAARKAGKIITNDAEIFFDNVKNPIIAVTGTRGKTTTTKWITHILKAKYPKIIVGGNSPEMPLLLLIDKIKTKKTPAVLELSSWQLEFVGNSHRAPDIALITNIYPDHLNRYKSMKDYALAKANIFKNQNHNQTLILNADNSWTKFFNNLKPKSRVHCFSKHFDFPHNRGLNRNALGLHNLENLAATILVARLAGIEEKKIISRIKSLPVIPYREETIVRKKNLIVVNDSAATTPEATIAALNRFISPNLILIAGGTDKKLSFTAWAKIVKKNIKPKNLFLLNGSATKKMLKELRKIGYFKKSKIQLFESFQEITKSIQNNLLTANYQKLTTILFSPSAASFEKFQNEFDRGEKFNLYSKRLF